MTSDTSTGGTYRPPCREEANTTPYAASDDLERRVCPQCRYYFSCGKDSDRVFCSLACERRYGESDELIADGGIVEDGNEQYEDAICPGCGRVLTGSREPGDRDYCQDAEREVTLAPANLNVRAHEVTNYDGPWPGPEWQRVRSAIEDHRDGERVPVAFRPRSLHTETEHSGDTDE